MTHKTTIKLLSLVLLFGLLSGCTGAGGQATPTVDPALEAETLNVVSATGVVVPARWSTLSMAGSGVVEQLSAAEGEAVQADQLLVQLSGADRLQAGVEAAELELTAARQALDELAENAEQARAQAQLRLANAEKAYDKAVERRGWKDYRPGSDAQIDEARANLILAEDALEKAEELYNGFASNAEDDVNRAAALSALGAARKNRDRALANLNYLLNLPDPLEVAQADAEVETARTELDAARREMEKLADGPNPEALELAQARVENAEAQLAAGRSALADLQLRAPFDGVISVVYIRQNEWLLPGAPTCQIADLSHLRVDTTDLSEIDVARVRVGDVATVTFDALPEAIITARVTHIAPKASEGAGVNYTVQLELDELPAGLLWGMTAFVDIEVGR